LSNPLTCVSVFFAKTAMLAPFSGYRFRALAKPAIMSCFIFSKV